jgi:hypothetical protein
MTLLYLRKGSKKMAFVNVIQGYYGDEKVAQSTKIGGLPLGTRMVLPDGRIFAHALAATVCVAGNIYQGKAVASGTALSEGKLAATAAVNATSVTVTMAGTGSMTLNEYEDGYLWVGSSTGTGLGRTYKIKGNTAAASTIAGVVHLYENDKITSAIGGTTATVGLRENEFSNVLITTADTAYTNVVAGVAPVAATACAYFWLQRRGPCAVNAPLTLIIGGPVVASSATAGAAASMIVTAGTTKILTPIGYDMTSAASAGYSLIYLTLD